MDRLQHFLYLMMRDRVPTGQVMEAISHVHDCEGKETIYSNAELAALAKRYADILRSA